MLPNNNDKDKIIREKLKGVQPEWDQNALWENINTALDDMPQSKPKRRYWWAFIPILSIGIGIGVGLSNLTDNLGFSKSSSSITASAQLKLDKALNSQKEASSSLNAKTLIEQKEAIASKQSNSIEKGQIAQSSTKGHQLIDKQKKTEHLTSSISQSAQKVSQNQLTQKQSKTDLRSDSNYSNNSNNIKKSQASEVKNTTLNTNLIEAQEQKNRTIQDKTVQVNQVEIQEQENRIIQETPVQTNQLETAPIKTKSSEETETLPVMALNSQNTENNTSSEDTGKINQTGNDFVDNKEISSVKNQEEAKQVIDQKQTNLVQALSSRSINLTSPSSDLKGTIKKSETVAATLTMLPDLLTPAQMNKGIYFVAYGGAALPIRQMESLDDEMDFYVNEIETYQSVLEANEFGLNIGYQSGRNWFIETGINRLQINERYEKEVNFKNQARVYSDTAFYYRDASNAVSYIADSVQVTVNTHKKSIKFYEHNYFNVPLLVGLNKSINKFEVVLAAGPSLNLSYKYQGKENPSLELDIANYPTEMNTWYKNKLGIGAQAKVALGYRLMNKHRIFTEFNYRYLPSSVSTNDSQFTQKYSSIGLNLGYRITL